MLATPVALVLLGHERGGIRRELAGLRSWSSLMHARHLQLDQIRFAGLLLARAAATRAASRFLLRLQTRR